MSVKEIFLKFFQQEIKNLKFMLIQTLINYITNV